jgi:hypothetical protein
MEDNVLAQSHLALTEEETETLEQYLAEILHLRNLIDADQIEIELLKAENRGLIAETRVVLTTLKATVLE